MINCRRRKLPLKPSPRLLIASPDFQISYGSEWMTSTYKFMGMSWWSDKFFGEVCKKWLTFHDLGDKFSKNHRLRMHDGHFSNSFRPLSYLGSIWIKSEKQNILWKKQLNDGNHKVWNIVEKRLHWVSVVYRELQNGHWTSSVKVEAPVPYSEGIEPWSPAWKAKALFIQPLYFKIIFSILSLYKLKASCSI